MVHVYFFRFPINKFRFFTANHSDKVPEKVSVLKSRSSSSHYHQSGSQYRHIALITFPFWHGTLPSFQCSEVVGYVSWVCKAESTCYLPSKGGKFRILRLLLSRVRLRNWWQVLRPRIEDFSYNFLSSTGKQFLSIPILLWRVLCCKLSLWLSVVSSRLRAQLLVKKWIKSFLDGRWMKNGRETEVEIVNLTLACWVYSEERVIPIGKCCLRVEFDDGLAGWRVFGCI